MADREHDDSPNPRMVVGTPQPRTSLGELVGWHAYQGTLTSFLRDIGYYYYHKAPGDDQDKSRGRER